MSVQERITQLSQKFGSSTKEFHEAVSQLLASEHRQATAGMAFAQPIASTSAFPGTPTSLHSQQQLQTPQAATPQTSSRGRTIKPTKPFTPSQSTPRASIVPPSTRPPLPSSNALRPPTSRVPLSSAPTPVPPLSRIADPRYQAQYSTYPARMRLGTSSLMQPNALAASGTGTNTPASSAGASGKRSRVINYAEIEGLEDSDDDANDADVRAKRAVYGGMVPKRVLALGGGGGGGGGGGEKVWGDGKSYLGVLPPGNLVVVQTAKVTKHGTFSEDQLEEQAAVPALLVPIQIDIDVATFKIRDAFVWNLNEKLITPEAFARVFCDDLDIPATWATEVAKQIQDQVNEQTGVAEIAVRSVEDESEHVEKDLRVVLNIDVQIGTLHLLDRIEWDLSSPLTPELFALTLVRDLSLSSSAAPLIAHAIHEELLRHKKLCLEMGLVGEDAAVAEASGRKRGAKQLEGVWRDWPETMSFGPRVEVLSLDEMDRVEADRERAIRRAKRDRLTGSRTAGRRR